MPPYDVAKASLLRSCPSAVFRSQPASDWRGEFPLPDAVADYFANFGPVDLSIDSSANPYFLPSLSKLWEYQAGYRYHGDTGERFPEWDDDWLVIGSFITLT